MTKTHRIELRVRSATGTVVNAKALQALLAVLVDGSQQAIRLVAQGRSRATGTPPQWIDKATEFQIEIMKGSTVLEVSAPSLREADPEAFSQDNLFPEIDADLTGFDYLTQALEAATGADDRSDLFDQGLLRTFSELGPVFSHGIEEIQFRPAGMHVRAQPRIKQADLEGFSDLERKIPAPQRVIVAAKLDTIRHSDSTFTLRPRSGQGLIKGLASAGHKDELKALWGKPVVVHGRAHFTTTGRIQRLEAERIEAASNRDVALWGEAPEPVSKPVTRSEVRVSQGPRSGLAATFGAWPGDEDEAEIREALERIS